MGPRSENRGYAGRVQGPRGGAVASMGPRSENRGYANHRPESARRNSASMGPRSENRGYVRPAAKLGMMVIRASMGPRSENRGYVRPPLPFRDQIWSFNGSTVREPWLCTATA